MIQQFANQALRKLKIKHTFLPRTNRINQLTTMALGRFNNEINPFFGHSGFDDFFAPTPFSTKDPFSDLMPVLSNLKRDEDMALLRSSPGYEISEGDGKYNIHVDVPGIKAADMNVALEREGKVLHISGGRKVTTGDTVSETRFEKRFTIGANVDTSKMTANLVDGVLTLTAPKIPEKEESVHKIAITEGPGEEKKKEIEL
jgi:HSP20 family protein